MSHQEILEKAISKAIDGGWNEILPTETWKVVTDRGLEVDIEMRSPYSGNLIGGRKDYMEIIFNHDFAKALWGDDPQVTITPNEFGQDNYILGLSRDYDFEPGEAWQFHLQQMVIADDPIAYLGEHL